MTDAGDRPTLSGVQFHTVRQLARAVAIPRLELAVERESGKASDRSVVLEGDELRLGSHPSNDLVINDPKVSRFHCRLSRGGSGWSLADNGSLNGTLLDGLRVRDADLPRPTCRLALGDSMVRVRELGSEAVEEVPTWSSFGELYGESVAMRQLFGVLDRVAKSDSTLLIEGESGTGKELAATEIARRGPRADAPFIIVDCSAISPNLIESELFGHTRGAFTGADKNRVGAFEAANGGTIFLDEVGEMPLDMQPKLLRALEAREIRRTGENEPRKIDVRVIAATNRRLEREVNRGRFREDLYFRLGVVTVRMPPLRKRLEDLGILIQVILRSLNAEEASHLFTPDVVADMESHDWPGNVRELRNYVERTVVLEQAAPASTPRSLESVLPPQPGRHSPAAAPAVDLEVPFKVAKDTVIGDFEQRYLKALLDWSGGNVSKAARRAKMDRMYLYRLLQRYELRGGSRIED
ncbi:MAG: sigma 54-dependent Fis family transcriptional regulator [Myxococcales bacterium]|nr:sigma 54-dependent Fis family transcriptional regulator [Myxococcales bacterium]MCB9578486.1 sigma 54-dependent Fis family transcriptional regulator [Polyangiaceae bacterium]